MAGVGVGARQHDGVAVAVGLDDAGQGGQLGRRSTPGSVARIVRGRPCALISVVGPSATTSAVGHQHDAVGVGVGLLEVVGGEHDRLAAGGEAAHRHPEGVAGLDVEGDGGLVEHQQVGVGHQGQGEAHPLGLAARQLVGAAVGDVGDAGGGEDLVDRHRVGVQRAPPSSRSSRTVEVADQRAGLQHGADRAVADGRRPAGGRTRRPCRGRAAPGRAACRWSWTCRRRWGRAGRPSRRVHDEIDAAHGVDRCRTTWSRRAARCRAR